MRPMRWDDVPEDLRNTQKKLDAWWREREGAFVSPDKRWIAYCLGTQGCQGAVWTSSWGGHYHRCKNLAYPYEFCWSHRGLDDEVLL